MSPQPRTWKRLCITGCPRGGTKFITKLIRNHEIDVGHEWLREDGTVDWVAAGGKWVWEWRYQFTDFDRIFNVVRYPTKVIGSLFTITPWPWISTQIPIDLYANPLVRNMQMWFHWNLAAEHISEWTFRLEDVGLGEEHVGDAFLELCDRIGVEPRPFDISHVGRDCNSRVDHEYYQKIVWQQMYEADKDLTMRIIDLAGSYGYYVNWIERFLR